jgi:hypothetical protein
MKIVGVEVLKIQLLCQPLPNVVSTEEEVQAVHYHTMM